jgi:hypothetical protein
MVVLLACNLVVVVLSPRKARPAIYAKMKKNRIMCKVSFQYTALVGPSTTVFRISCEAV